MDPESWEALFASEPPEEGFEAIDVEFDHHDTDFATPSSSGHPGELASPQFVTDTAWSCLAAMQGRLGGEAVDMVGYILASTEAIELMDPDQVRSIKRLQDVLLHAFANATDEVVDYADLPDADAAGAALVARLRILANFTTPPTNPVGTWRSVVERVKRARARSKALAFAAACTPDAPDDELMSAFRALTPPTASTQVRNNDFAMSASEWEARYKSGASAPIRISSGYPTWDWALTAKNPDGTDAEPFGAFAPGEFHVIAGATGNGKSAIARVLLRNMAADLVEGWQLRNARLLYAFTEENAHIVLRAASLGSSDPFHYLAKNTILANVGPSRKRLVHAVWDEVIRAHHASKEAGIPITEAGLPYVIFWDYIGGTAEAGESVDTVAAQVNADLAMRGFAQWDVLAMETFSGESFAAYAGMPWPAGMEFFRPVVIAFAQFRKLADPVWYDPQNRSCNLADFTVENADGSPGWQVLPGDFRVPTQSEIRGSGILANHATAIYVLHRSRPQKNPKVKDPVTGNYRLVDDRARIIPTKTRNSTDLAFFPMRFDSQPSGVRGQFYDLLAESGLAAGSFNPGSTYNRPGDPMLPPRQVRTPFDLVTY